MLKKFELNILSLIWSPKPNFSRRLLVEVRGGNDEEPHAHIRHFESITNNQRYPDVPNTTIKLLLFPFSLDGVAKTWLEKEPPNSILTWDDLVSKFINFFFPPSKTTNLRNEITNFRQIAQESFSEAWERFKELLRKCPSTGFSLMHQLDTFYNSLSYNDQDSLNSAAGGNFLYKSPNEGLQIIENKAKVRCSRNAVMRVSTNAPPTSSNSSSNFEFQQMAAALEDKMTLTFRNEMTEMKNMMKAFVPTPVPIKAVEERCTTCGNNHSFNMCPMTRGGYEAPVYHDNFQQFQQTASVVKKTTEGSMQAMRNHITNLKAEIRSEVHATLQNQINSLKGEFKNELKTQHNLFVNQQNEFQNNLQNMSCEKETEVTKDKVLPSTKNIQPPVIQKSQDPVKPVSSPISPEPSSAQVDNSPPSKEPFKETKLPYPSRVEREKKDSNDKVQIQKFWEMFKKIHVDITLADALILMPKYQKMLKSLLTNKDKLIEIAKTPMNANCSAVILKKLPEKLGDPGRFLIPCGFGEFDKHLALADLGASINLMPLSIWKKLGLPDLTSTRMVLELADRTISKPLGIGTRVQVFRILEASWFYISGRQRIPQFPIRGLQSSLSITGKTHIYYPCLYRTTNHMSFASP
ncbi:reverse transcriptase domain-containing protein [Tanacetum coccineum]